MTQTSMASKLEALAKPFAKEQVKRRQGSFNRSTGKPDMYDYVDAEAVMARLREVFGIRFRIKVLGMNQEIANLIVTRPDGKGEVIVGVELSYYDDEIKDWCTASGIGSKVVEEKKDAGDSYKAALSKAVKSAAKQIGVPIDGGLEDDEDAPTGETPAFPPIAGGFPNKPAPAPAVAPAPAAAPAPAPASAPAPTASPFGKAAPAAAPAPQAAPAAVVPPRPAFPPPASNAAPAPAPAPVAPPAPVAAVAPTPPAAPAAVSGDAVACSNCSNVITESVDADGDRWTAAMLIQETVDTYGVPLCVTCVGSMPETDEEG